jgi:hypothetical protein
LPWLGRSNMATTLKAFWGPTLLMLRDKYVDSQFCNSPFFFCTCVWGLWNEQQKCNRDDEWEKMPLLCIWVISSKLPWLESYMATTLKVFWGPTLLMFLERHNDSQSCNSPFRSCKCAWVFFTICKIRPFPSIMYLRLLLQSCHGLEAIYYIEQFLGTYICWCFLASMIESCNSPFFSCNCVCGLWHKQQTCHRMMNERRRCHYYARGKTWHEKLSMLNTCVFNNVSQIFFSIGQPTMDHENVH